MVELLGIIGGLLFMYSGIPVAWQCIKTKSATHLPQQLMWTVMLGAIFMLAYITLKLGFDWLVWAEYIITILVWLIVIYYRYFGKQDNGNKEVAD